MPCIVNSCKPNHACICRGSTVLLREGHTPSIYRNSRQNPRSCLLLKDLPADYRGRHAPVGFCTETLHLYRKYKVQR